MLPLHNHSEYSALDGFSKPDEIAARLKAIGLEGAFLTDHGTVAGWRTFEKTMKAAGLWSGYGVEAYQAKVHRDDRPGTNVRDASHLILLAKDLTGARNIMRLTDEAARTGVYYHPRVDWELLEKYHEGVLCTSACVSGLVAKGIRDGDETALTKFLKIFGNDFFIEIHTYDTEDQWELNEALVSLATERGIPMVYANDAHYAKPEDYKYHSALVCMQTNSTLKDPALPMEPCLYIMDEADVRERLGYLDDKIIDQCIDNSELVRSMCNVEFPKSALHLPVYIPDVPTEMSNKELFIDAVSEGMDRRLPDAGDEYYERLEEETTTIINAGLADYFLITANDMCRWADSVGIARGPGRGSVGGSLVAYALGITDIDPIKYGLFFERFYNAGREEGLPDIDIDFEQARRDELDVHLKSKYGEFNVISIGTHIRMKPKASIDKLAKPLYGNEVNYSDLNKIKAIIEKTVDAGIQPDWEEVLEMSEEEMEPYLDKYPELFEYAQVIGGRISTYGVHASAIVLSDIDLRNELPGMSRVKRDDDGVKNDRVIATQVEMHEVEDLGFPKFDRLGLRTLDTLMEVAPKEEYLAIDWDNMPDEMWDLIDKGKTLGFFQVEAGMARHIGKKLRPRNILDLAAIVALNRPGPLRTGAAERFLNFRNNGGDPTYADPILEPLLHWTYGDFIYQEQVIQYFRTIGYDLKEADDIRSMLGKKKVEAMRAEHPRYMERATKLMPATAAQKIWDDIVGFSKYSFNLAHAVGYALLLAWCCYAKWKYPVKFIMACIHTNSKRAGEYVAEGRRLGVDIAPPNINESDVFVEQKGDTIFYGLADVKGVGVAAAQYIIDHRPYRDREDFEEQMDRAVKDHKDIPKDERPKRSPRQICTAGAIKALYNAGAFDTLEERDLTTREIAELQQQLLGVTLVDDTAAVIEANPDKFDNIWSLSDLDDPANFEDTLKVAGVIQSVRPITSRNGNNMGFVKIEWEGEEAEICVSPKYWDKFKFLLVPQTVCIFRVTPQERGLSFDGATKLHAAEE